MLKSLSSTNQIKIITCEIVFINSKFKNQENT